jgi:hypothetical protein
MATAPKQSFIRTRYPDFPRYPRTLIDADETFKHTWNEISNWSATLIRALEEANTRTVFFVVEDNRGSIKVDGRIQVGEVGVSVTPVAGDMRYNTSTNKHQGFNGTSWNDFY